jgi:hypothetical protein
MVTLPHWHARVVDRRDPAVDIEIVPADPVDPYRWGTAAWTVSAGGETSYITANMSADEAGQAHRRSEPAVTETAAAGRPFPQ